MYRSGSQRLRFNERGATAVRRGSTTQHNSPERLASESQAKDDSHIVLVYLTQATRPSSKTAVTPSRRHAVTPERDALWRCKHYAQYTPPLMSSVAPVMKPSYSDAKYTTGRAMSSA